MKTDEAAFGVSYEENDDFLEGKPVSERAYRVIVSTYSNTAHKRNLPITPE